MASIEHMDKILEIFLDLEDSVKLCNSNVPKSSLDAAAKIQEDLEDNQMSIAEYQKEMANLNKIAESFQSECSCTMKVHGKSKLILPLKKAPRIESKIIAAPRLRASKH